MFFGGKEVGKFEEFGVHYYPVKNVVLSSLISVFLTGIRLETKVPVDRTNLDLNKNDRRRLLAENCRLAQLF